MSAPDIDGMLELALELYLEEFPGHLAEDFVSYCCMWLERRSGVDPASPERQAMRSAVERVCLDVAAWRMRKPASDVTPLGLGDKSFAKAVQIVASKMKIFATFPEGGRVCVRRPAKPELAVQLAKAAVGQKDPNAIERITAMCGPYTFVGYVADGDGEHTILDEDGRPVGSIQPGDSITDEGS
jgi:hypothetical protein